MKMHPWTPSIAIVCLTAYGISLAALGIDGTMTVLVVGSISGLGGFGIKSVLHDKEKERLVETVRRMAADLNPEDQERNESVKERTG